MHPPCAHGQVLHVHVAHLGGLGASDGIVVLDLCTSAGKKWIRTEPMRSCVSLSFAEQETEARVAKDLVQPLLMSPTW